MVGVPSSMVTQLRVTAGCVGTLSGVVHCEPKTGCLAACGAQPLWVHPPEPSGEPSHLRSNRGPQGPLGDLQPLLSKPCLGAQCESEPALRGLTGVAGSPD